MSKTLEEVRREYRDNKDSWETNRGFSRCMFCNSYSSGQWIIPGLYSKAICDKCLTGQSAQAPPRAQAPAVSGETMQIPYLTVKDEDKKNVNVTVEVRMNRDDVDFQLVHESNTWKMENYYKPVQRRSYFVKKSARVTIGIQNLEPAALILKILYVDENLDPGAMQTVTLQPNGVHKIQLDRSDGEDRESLKICDSSGKLSLMLSVQEELPSMSRKRSLGEGSAAAPIRFDDDSALDMSLRSLRLMGQAL